MRDNVYCPESFQKAEAVVSEVCGSKLAELEHEDFMRVWCAVVYLNPGLHTDNILDPDYECSPLVRRVLEEVWRRADSGDITDAEMYPYEVIRARLVA